MELNKLAGRTFNDLMQYPVFPFVISNYTDKELDLSSDKSFRYKLKFCFCCFIMYRKLELPISIQDESKKKKYIDTYEV